MAQLTWNNMRYPNKKNHTGKSAGFIHKQASEHERILKACWDDLITFGKLFLPGDFRKSETPGFHYEIADELISMSTKPCAMIIARGHGKTTLTKAKVVRDFCFAEHAHKWGLDERHREHLFYGWCSTNQRKSQNNVSYVRLNLRHNNKLHFYFGHQLGAFKRDNQEDILTGYNDRLLSGSNLSSFRGDTLATMESGAVRYSCVIADDAENEENTRTQASRDKIAATIMDGIYPAIEKNRPGCRLFFICTPVHYDSFSQRVMDMWQKVKGTDEAKDFAWKVIMYPASQPSMPGGVLWPSWMSRKVLDGIKKTYQHSPRGVSGYYQEYELEVQSRDNALWRREHIKIHDGIYKYEDGQGYLKIEGDYIPVNCFVGCDPATDIDTKDSDYSVILATAVDKDNNTYVLEYERHRSIPTMALRKEDGEIDGKMGVVDYIVKLYDKYHCKSGCVEDVAMTRSILQDLNAYKKIHNRFDIAIIPEKPGGLNKINRIYTSLNSRFASGSMYVRDNQYDLIDEILKFGPKLAHDDTIDALYYACRYAFPAKPGEYNHELGKEVLTKKKKAKSWIVA